MSGYGDAEPTPSAERWQLLSALGIVAGDPTAGAVARLARLLGLADVTIGEAAASLDRARRKGWLDTTSAPTGEAEAVINSVLSDQQRFAIETEVALTRLAEGPERLTEALVHARSAAAGSHAIDLVPALDRAGRMALELADYRASDELLSLAAEIDRSPRSAGAAARLCDLSEVADGLGDPMRARQLLVKAFGLADAAGIPAVAGRAAIALCLLDDGVAADGRAAALLRRAAALELSTDDRIAVEAAQALIERRLPSVVVEGRPVAWVARSSLGHSLADAVFARSADSRIESRAIALRAWRATHSSPAYLHRRREVSAELLDVTQRFRSPAQQYDAAEWVAVDCIESADRAGYDRAVELARWLAEHDGNPRLVRRSLLLAAGAAHLDGDALAATRLVERAGSLDEQPDPVAELTFAAQSWLAGADTADRCEHLIATASSELLNEPLHRVVVAALRAGRGDHLEAEQHLRRVMRQLEPEQDLILIASRISDVALKIGADDLCRDLVGVLAPWAGHVAVDGRGWWCDGPVALQLGRLHHALDDRDAAWRCLEQGEATARSLNGVVAAKRAAVLRDELEQHGPAPEPVKLTTREHQVLTRLASGLTNPQIALELAHSVATIRADTISIYRKLGAKGRADASARAQALGLISVTRPTGQDLAGRIPG